MKDTITLAQYVKFLKETLDQLDKAGRSPYGERGLKSTATITATTGSQSLSLRRAWIEITTCNVGARPEEVALLTESVD